MMIHGLISLVNEWIVARYVKSVNKYLPTPLLTQYKCIIDHKCQTCVFEPELNRHFMSRGR